MADSYLWLESFALGGFINSVVSFRGGSFGGWGEIRMLPGMMCNVSAVVCVSFSMPNSVYCAVGLLALDWGDVPCTIVFGSVLMTRELPTDVGSFATLEKIGIQNGIYCGT